MKLIQSKTLLIVVIVLFACCTQETEGLRRVLRGRRTFTRSKYEGLAIPGWALVACIAVAELIIGAALYFVMYKFIITKEEQPTNTYTPAPTSDPTPTPTPPATAAKVTPA